MTALNYHVVPVMPLSQRWKEEVDVTEKEREEDIEIDAIDLSFYSCFFSLVFFFSWAPVVWKGRLCGSKIFQRREYTVCAQLDMFIEEILPCLEKGHFYFCMFYCEKLPTAQSHLKSPEEQLSAVVFHLWGWLMFIFKMTACTAYKMCRNFTWPYQNPN